MYSSSSRYAWNLYLLHRQEIRTNRNRRYGRQSASSFVAGVITYLSNNTVLPNSVVDEFVEKSSMRFFTYFRGGLFDIVKCPTITDRFLFRFRCEEETIDSFVFADVVKKEEQHGCFSYDDCCPRLLSYGRICWDPIHHCYLIMKQANHPLYLIGRVQKKYQSEC